ncbi:MAG: PqqD family protein [Acidobacteria bacterium]|nr:PqqD family protein [Acidobacteriota bacterium]
MKKHIVARELPDELLLYDPQTDAVHILNPTARMIFTRHDEGASPEDIVAALRQRYEIAAGIDVLADVRTCLETFRQKNLI